MTTIVRAREGRHQNDYATIFDDGTLIAILHPITLKLLDG